MNFHISDFNVDSVVLDLGSNVNILMKKTQERMGKPQLVWSLVKPRLVNQAKVSPISIVCHLRVEFEGLKRFVDFNVIEIVKKNSTYPELPGIGWESDNLAIINFKKRVMKFDNHDMRIIAPLYFAEGRRYVELVKEEFVGILDHAYNISKYYINPTVDGDLGW